MAESAKKGKALETLGKELTPVMAKRVVQAYKAVRDKRGDLYPMKNVNGHIMYYLTSKELVTRTIGPRPSRESREYLEWKKASMLEQERKEVLQDIKRAIVDDDMDTANKLINKYQVVPTTEAIENEILKRNLSREERAALKPPGKKKEYQEQREGGQESVPPENLSEKYDKACETISEGKFPTGVVKEHNRVQKRLKYLRKELKKVKTDPRYSAKQQKNRVKKIEADIAREQRAFLKYMESK